MESNPKSSHTFYYLSIGSPTIPYLEGMVGRKIIPPKYAEYIIKFIKYLVKINKNEFNKNRRQKKCLVASKIQCWLLLAKLLIIIFESANLHFLTFY